MLRAAKVETHLPAIAWVTLATALFSLSYASGKLAGGGVPPMQILFFRYVGGFLTLLLVVKSSGQSLTSYRSARPFSHLVRAMCGASGGGALIYASAHMPIMDATALGLLYVVFIIPLGMIVLGERILRRQSLAIAACCIGAMIIVASRGAFTQFPPGYLFPASIAVLGAALLALEGLLIKTLSHADRPMTVLLHVNAFGVILMALPAMALWTPISLTTSLCFLLLGPLAVTAQYCIIQGYRSAPLSVVGPVDYTWLIFAGLIGYVVFGEPLTSGVVIGSFVIAVGGIVLAGVKAS